MVRAQICPACANLKGRCPDGIYLSLTPGNPTQWSGILFVRKGHKLDEIGPYAPAILRFGLSFLPGYPDSPALITFLTDIFHPLVTPLTTYTYTTIDAVNTADEERLPPGGFSLGQHRDQPSMASNKSSRNVSGSQGNDQLSTGGSSSSQDFAGEAPAHQQTCRNSALDMLIYVKRAFDDVEFLDHLPAEAAANMGAWKAWRAYRRNAWQDSSVEKSLGNAPGVMKRHNGEPSTQRRPPDEWNWNGVWEQRVKKGVDASISDHVLFGAAGETEIVGFALHTDIRLLTSRAQMRFHEIQVDTLATVRQQIARS
ncbi:MAG: hypothetical protein Q9218_000189 [Villophora microphyllina]